MNPDHTLDNIKPISVNTTKEAIGIIAFLMSFDERFKSQPFSAVINDIYGAAMHGFYSIAAREVYSNNADGPLIQPLAAVMWGMFSPTTAVVRANNIRQLAPIEYKSGNKCFFTIFSSPFEDPRTMLELLRTKDQKLHQMNNITFVDKLFKPDYNFNI